MTWNQRLLSDLLDSVGSGLSVASVFSVSQDFGGQVKGHCCLPHMVQNGLTVKRYLVVVGYHDWEWLWIFLFFQKVSKRCSSNRLI